MRLNVFLTVLIFSVVGFAASGKKKDFIAQGYVLEMESVSQFDLDDYEIHCLPTTRVKIPQADGSMFVGACRAEAIRVGAELEVTGEYDPATEKIEATEIIAIRQEADPKIRGTALIERAPALQKSGVGWAGTIDVDGRRLAISPETEIRYTKRTSKKTSVDEFNSPEQVAPNVWVAYSGVRGSDGVIKVDRAVFSRNATSKKEGKFRDKYDAVVKEPDYGAKKAGEATIKGIKPFTILADKGLQERISRIGASLVPAYQRALADNDPAKIKFRFYVVDGLKFASIHSADGSVFISSGVFGRLSNEAQLAGVIAADIASVVQEHDFRIHSSAEWSQALCWSSVGTSFLPMGLGLPVSALVIANGFGVQRQINSLYGQAGRLAIEYSVGAGYDPREVRSAFKALSKKSDVGMKLKGSERAYYMAAAAEASNELGLAYSGTDFSKLNSDAESYRNLAEEVKSAREK